jgi:hypothetical protein
LSKEQEEQNQFLTEETAKKIKNWGEYVFATAITSIEHLQATYQVPVGEKRIDFWVKNLKLNGKSRGKWVEVTSTSIKKAGCKRKQLNAMIREGLPHTILYGENLMKIEAHNKRGS